MVGGEIDTLLAELPAAIKRRDLRGCGGCKDKMLATMKGAIAPARIQYDLEYYERMLRQNSATGEHIAQVRWRFIWPALKAGVKNILDYGSGVDWFRAWRPPSVEVWSYDIGPFPQTGDKGAPYDLVCMWDVLEHLPEGFPIPEILKGAQWWAFSVPVLPPGQDLRTWKHYKPSEHLRTFTRENIMALIEATGFQLCTEATVECPPRQDIMSFLCERKVIAEASGAVPPSPRAPTPSAPSSRRVILRQGQSPGDILTMTRAVYDLCRARPDWQIDVRSPCPEIWQGNPLLCAIPDTEAHVETFDITYPAINQAARMGWLFADAFHADIETQLGISYPKTGFAPELFLSESEITNRPLPFRYWLLNAGCKPDNELKQYHRWPEVVLRMIEALQGRVSVVQVGAAVYNHSPVTGAVNMLGKTSLRELIVLAYHAEGILTPISLPFVLAAACDKPCVVVAGGKETATWHRYNGIRWLDMVGALKCCERDGCWRGGAIGSCIDLADGVPRCFTLIEPDAIVQAAMDYYRGGRLVL